MQLRLTSTVLMFPEFREGQCVFHVFVFKKKVKPLIKPDFPANFVVPTDRFADGLVRMHKESKQRLGP